MCVRALNRNWADAKRERDVCACWTETEQTDGERKRCVHVLGKQDLARQYQRFSEGAFTPDANDANKSRYSREVGRLNILSLLASFARKKIAPFAREICAIHAWNSLHNRCECASWEGLLPGSSSLVAKCIPVFVKVRRCIYSSGYPHTTTITLSSIFVLDFLPPLVMTSLLEQAPDWLTRREYPPKFRFFNSRHSRLVWTHLETK